MRSSAVEERLLIRERNGALLDSNSDNRGGLEDLPFSYRASKEGRVFVSWRGQQVTVLKGRHASSFLSRIEGLDAQGTQLEMAKATGNFRRGNE